MRERSGLDHYSRQSSGLCESSWNDDNSFKAPPGWIAGCLKRAGKISINLHGEAMDLIDEQAEDLIRPFREELRDAMEKYDVTLERTHNADQTGLYYNKPPNRIYVSKADHKNYSGCKHMKAKD
jgi:hypothetical protein